MVIFVPKMSAIDVTKNDTSGQKQKKVQFEFLISMVDLVET